MSFLLIFVDGLGIGSSDPVINPCVQPHLNHLNCYFMDDHQLSHPDCLPVDATLGMDGLPQSATGQTTLITGCNAGRHIGRHKQGFPNQALRDLIISDGLMGRLVKQGHSVRFLNAYRPMFDRLPTPLKWRLSATTIHTLAAGQPFMTLEDVRNEQALYHDITNDYLIQKGFSVPRFTPEQAGEILANRLHVQDFCMFEYFMTDRAGHGRDPEQSKTEVMKLDRMLTALIQNADLENHCILITSDHGNIDELSVKTHTQNPVLTRIWGHEKGIGGLVGKLEDITPAILKWFEDVRPAEGLKPALPS